MKDNIWKWIAGLLVSILLSAGGTFYATTGDFATKTEMRQALQSDHDVIRETRDDVKQLAEKIERLNREIGELKAMISRR